MAPTSRFLAAIFRTLAKQLASTYRGTSVSTMSLYQKKDYTVRHSFSFFDGDSDCAFAATRSTTETDTEDRLLG
jgi:hypothetical protein